MKYVKEYGFVYKCTSNSLQFQKKHSYSMLSNNENLDLPNSVTWIKWKGYNWFYQRNELHILYSLNVCIELLYV